MRGALFLTVYWSFQLREQEIEVALLEMEAQVVQLEDRGHEEVIVSPLVCALT